MMVDHAYAECTGNWRLSYHGNHRVIKCDICGTHTDASQENRLAAIDENYAGIYLRRLTAEGLLLLEKDE